jgi:hypothetical protein
VSASPGISAARTALDENVAFAQRLAAREIACQTTISAVSTSVPVSRTGCLRKARLPGTSTMPSKRRLWES